MKTETKSTAYYYQTKHCRKVKLADGRYVCSQCWAEIDKHQYYPWCLNCLTVKTAQACQLHDQGAKIGEISIKLHCTNNIARWLLDYRQPTRPYFSMPNRVVKKMITKREVVGAIKDYKEYLTDQVNKFKPMNALERARLRITK